MSIESGAGNQVPEIESSARSIASFPTELISYTLPALDALIILLSCLAGAIGYHLLIGDPFEVLSLCAVGLLAGFIYILRMNGSGYYELQESAKPRLEVREMLVCWFTTGLLLVLIAFLLKISAAYSRGAVVIFYVLAPVALLAARKATKVVLAQAMARGAIGGRDNVLIGDPNEMAALKSDDLLTLCGAPEARRFTLNQEDNGLARSLNDIQIMDAAADYVRHHNCRQVLIALPWSDAGRIEFIRDQLKSLPVVARLLPDKRVRALSDLTWSTTHKPSLAIDLQRAPLSEVQRLVKRITDVVVASFALAFFLPIMTIAAVAIKMDNPGPVIFRQIRKGFNGKQFHILKFRTMTVQENGPNIVQATRDDSRVTTVGRLLRSSSIDELPQLWNVLKGDMSLVGPRPHALAHDDYFETLLRDYAFRHHVKPGITGWAQCNGVRGAMPTIEHTAKRVKLDLWYINNWSLWLDLLIVVKTIFEVLRRRNAY
jgi:Undecaprenyl-phosphate glucose phosphotransferase